MITKMSEVKHLSLYLLGCAMLSVLESSDCICIHGDVRLVGGSGNYEGNVQVCIDGVWGYVCHRYWDTKDARVVCRQLGYNTTDVSYRRNSYYGYGNGSIWLNDVDCTGSEDRLIDCSTGQIICDHDELAGVYCAFAVGGSNCTNGDIRLGLRYSYYHSYYNSRSEGRVEICYYNEWGTVCDHGWDSTDATVVCEQLGYTGLLSSSYHANYGVGSGSIWLDDISCSSSHTNLLDCDYSTNTTDCTHSNDAQVQCYSLNTSSCTNGTVQLWSAYDSTPDDEGIPLVCVSGTWYPMRYTSNCYAYVLACKAAGYTGLRDYGYNGGQKYGYYYYDHYQFSCSSSATSNLNSCSKYLSSNEWLYSARVRCYTKQSQTGNCTEGSVRLTNGKSSNEGRAEYCYNNEWAPMCDMNQYTAHLICKQLGYGNVSDNNLIILNGFGKSDTISQFNYLYCYSVSTLSECSVQVSSCTAASCNVHYGLRCYADGKAALPNTEVAGVYCNFTDPLTANGVNTTTLYISTTISTTLTVISTLNLLSCVDSIITKTISSDNDRSSISLAIPKVSTTLDPPLSQINPTMRSNVSPDCSSKSSMATVGVTLGVVVVLLLVAVTVLVLILIWSRTKDKVLESHQMKSMPQKLYSQSSDADMMIK